MMTQRSRRLGLAVAAAFVMVSGLVMQAPAGALPTNPPKNGMVCASGGPTFDLVATTGDIQTPDGNSVFMWSYADQSGDFQYPGPVLCVTQGQTVTINLTNDLPDATSIVFPGQDAPVTATGGSAGLLATEAAASGGTVSYSFTAGNPGTYLYESGTDVSKQIEMGLYGALVVRPSMGPNFAYNAASTQFNPGQEFLMLLSEIDPDLHHAVEVGGIYDYTAKHNRYFSINGRSFPDTIQENGSSLLPTQPYGSLVRMQPTGPSSQPALIRMINAGTDNHPFHPHGNHLTQIAQDGRTVARTEHFGESVGAGQTEDFLLRWDNQTTDTSGAPFNDNWNPTTNPLPVPQPNYRNLTFKDGDTWYSGNPYLGYKGTLPVGTNSLNVCGEWYFPWHSHALNEFSNFDAGFGGMGTLLRIDPPGGCSVAATSTTLVGGKLKGGNANSLAASDNSYYQVNPTTTTVSLGINTNASPTTTLSNAVTSAGQSSILVASNTGFPATPYIRIDNEVMRITAKGAPSSRTWTVSRGQLGSTATTHSSGAGVAYVIAATSAAGFPSSGNFYIRIGTEVLQVTGGQGTQAWNVTRGQLGTPAATHAAGSTITALANDWYAAISGVPAGSQNLKVTYEGKNCGNTTGTGCPAIATNLPKQTVKICDWTISGAAGCSSATSNGWVTLPGAPVQPQNVGSTDVTSTWTLPGPGSNYIGTGPNTGAVRILVHTQRWTATNPTPFSTWGDFMRLVYDAP
jgi:FtsP/CotA-like multicopper oxidase with cupredoxin domain